VNIGAENRTKVYWAAGLGVLALILAVSQFGGWFSNTSSSAAAPTPTASSADFGKDPLPARRSGGRSRNANSRKPAAAPQSLDPTLRFDLLKTSEDTKYAGTGRNIFRVFVDIPPVVTPPVKHEEQVANNQPPPPPPPPPSNLHFYGFATPQGGTKRIFLTKNEDVFIAKEGDIVDRRYKVVRISPNSVEILDVLSNNRENIPLAPG
jgi:hypothetical protein